MSFPVRQAPLDFPWGQPETVDDHPALVMPDGNGEAVAITVCAECGKLRTVLWLDQDRWYCSSCRTQGRSKPKMFPIA